MKNLIKYKVRKALDVGRDIFFNKQKDTAKGLLLYVRPGQQSAVKPLIEEITKRMHYFDKDIPISIVTKLRWYHYIDFSIIGVTNAEDFKGIFKIKKDRIFNLDIEKSFMEGWHYHEILSAYYYKKFHEGTERGQKRLLSLTRKLQKQYNKAYILGTGPSLEKAIDEDWTDGIRIVSNTIVKDEELWNHMNPNIIVAGDGIYHFGFGQFPTMFRQDLRLRLKTNADTYFIFPAIFYIFCAKEFPEFEDRLIPIPYGPLATLHHDLTKQYFLPAFGNVLPLLLLPVACTLSKNVNLWGFDGRSPDAKLFWKNSSKQFYTDQVDELKVLHKAFFDNLVPKDNPEKYVNSVHGDVLEDGLTKAEADGYTFNMLHFSYTETLMKRFVKKTEA